MLPVLPGAVDVVEAGIVSTLQGQNERDNAAIVGESKSDSKAEMEKRRGDARFRLLFDPQVSSRWTRLFVVVAFSLLPRSFGPISHGFIRASPASPVSPRRS